MMCCQLMTICSTTSHKTAETTQRDKNNNNNLFNYNSCLRLSVLDVACSVDGLSVYFAYRLCLKETEYVKIYLYADCKEICL